MKQVGGVWLPDGETHLVEWMQKMNRVVDGKLTYQYHKLEKALTLIPPERRRRAVDIGGHAGTWSMHLVKEFQHVEAFEPLASHRECFIANVPKGRYTLHPFALGEKSGMVGMREVPASTGSAHVWGAGEIEMRTLDSFAFDEVDFIKIDVEGIELAVCKGAEKTIREQRPFMVVEQKGNEIKKYGEKARDQAVAWLDGLGMKRLACMGGDWIMGW